jgi:hypothetical protein
MVPDDAFIRLCYSRQLVYKRRVARLLPPSVNSQAANEVSIQTWI